MANDNQFNTDHLSDEAFEVTQNAGTEKRFSGKLLDNKEDGMYHCVVCNEPLFSSDTKFDSGSGWPSFYAAADDDKIELKPDNSHGMKRTEVTCSNCGAHIGHLFPDGPEPTGQRYCLNSAALDFQEV